MHGLASIRPLARDTAPRREGSASPSSELALTRLEHLSRCDQNVVTNARVELLATDDNVSHCVRSADVHLAVGEGSSIRLDLVLVDAYSEGFPGR